MESIRATQVWQHAGVYAVRVEAMVKGYQISLNGEFDQLDGPDSQYILIVDEYLPVATCRLHFVDRHTAKIERVCVLESHRGKGLGRRLIEDAEAWLLEYGIERVIITSRDVAVGFYEQLGYTPDWNRTEDGFFKTVYTEKYIIRNGD